MTFRGVSIFGILYLVLTVVIDARRKGKHFNLNTQRPFDSEVLSIDDLAWNKVPTGQLICHAAPARSFKPLKENIWLGLSEKEVSDIKKWINEQNDIKEYHIVNVEWMPPNKTDALKYLDGGGSPPLRYAQATLRNRTSDFSYFQNILVGPLPVKQRFTTWQYLSYPFTKKSNGAIRSLEYILDPLYSKYLPEMGKAVEDITIDLWNASVASSNHSFLGITSVDPMFQDDGIYGWFGFNNYVKTIFDVDTLYPLGLYFGFNMTGDQSKWHSLGWLYDDVHYKTTDEFRKAYKSGKLRKLREVPSGVWATTDRRGPRLPLDEHAPPTNVAPSGSRFYVDKQNKVVKWMDFEFSIGFTRNTGLRLFNIMYKGQRIVYELGLQEALAHYAANDPVQSGTSYLDSYYNIGADANPLIDGYDCPTYSEYLNISSTRDDPARSKQKNLCLFEIDPGYPLARHFAYNYEEATKNIYLTLRSVSTVGNYDYQFSYEFYMDGTIRIVVRASGYIQATYQAKNHGYGYQIHEHLSGSMHDHVLNYKIDMDVVGTKNSVEVVEVVPHTQVYPWSHGKARNTMKLKRTYIKSEDDSKLFWGHNAAKQYKIVNRDQLNKYGEPRGYRIFPSSGAIHLTVQNSTNLGRAAEWANHDLFITKQKDTEPRSADPNNGQDTNDPLVDFSQFFDGDSLEQEDLVVWANLGMHHVPHTGDLPNTVFTTASSGLTIMPINYLDEDPSVQTAGRVRVNLGRQPRAISFGQNYGSCRMNVTGDEQP